MSLSKIPVAAIQPRAHGRNDFEAAWPHIAELANMAAERGAKLIVLPEATVPGYVLGTDPVRADELAGAFEDLREIAIHSGATIVYGGAKIVDGLVYNAAICIGPDGLELGHAAKQFLWHFDRRWFEPGTSLRPVETPLGKLGLLVCADGRIPTIAATLVERGARLLVMPTAWVTSGRDPLALENIQADLMVNVRARENGVPFVVANKCGIELDSVAYCGKSAIVDAGGAFVARGSETAEEIVFGEVDLAASGAEDARPERTGAIFALAAERSNAATALARRPSARIAFTTARRISDLERFAKFAAHADCDLIVARDPDGAPATTPSVAAARWNEAGALGGADGVAFAVVDDATLHAPRGLVDARLDGVDFIVWCAGNDDAGWQTRFARTRATELRAYVLVFDEARERAFAVDPDGIVVAGTFGEFRMASFVYDRARTHATTVAPTTDVFAGLQRAEAIRARSQTQAFVG
ncbi:MAG: carbon-nitrogen hydrolase family protein [Candidatus Eremiobacteraeota bacterium]|nr:carbon-nitrogen hydrolase family protein [Candidatus Eremiobacteraeota bacterium]